MVIFSVLASWLLLGAAMLISGIMFQPIPCEKPAATWSPPNVQLCPDDIGLWECISTVAYREDI